MATGTATCLAGWPRLAALAAREASEASALRTVVTDGRLAKVVSSALGLLSWRAFSSRAAPRDPKFGHRCLPILTGFQCCATVEMASRTFINNSEREEDYFQ